MSDELARRLAASAGDATLDVRALREALARRAADDGLWSQVRALPAKQRAAIVHRFVLDLAYAEIGSRMGTSEEAARQNVSAGLRRLRREVAP